MCSSTKCYTFVDDMGRTWSDARDNCVSLGGELLPDIQAAQADMEKAIQGRMCTSTEYTYWTGQKKGMTNMYHKKTSIVMSLTMFI